MFKIEPAVIEEARDRISVLSKRLKDEISGVESQFEGITYHLYTKLTFSILIALGMCVLMFFIPSIIVSDNVMIVAGYNIMAYSILIYLLAANINNMIRYFSCMSTKKAIDNARRLSDHMMRYVLQIDELANEVNDEINTGSGYFQRNTDISALYNEAMEKLANCNVSNTHCNDFNTFKDVMYWPCSLVSIIGFALLLAPGLNNMIDSVSNVNIGDSLCATINIVIAIIAYALINYFVYTHKNTPGIGIYIADIGAVTVCFPVVLLVIAVISIIVATFAVIVCLLILGGIIAGIFSSKS